MESRREWLMMLFERAGSQNCNNKNWQLWQQHNKPIGLYNSEIFYQKLQYIHNNPVVAGIVEKEEDYLYSSARDFYGMQGLIELSYVV